MLQYAHVLMYCFKHHQKGGDC